MKKTSIHYKMVLTIIPCLFFIPLPHFQYREDIYAHPCFQDFPKQFTDDYLSNHLHGQEARKVFIQQPWYNIEVLLKRTKVGRAIVHSHWPKVARTFSCREPYTHWNSVRASHNCSSFALDSKIFCHCRTLTWSFFLCFYSCRIC